MPEALQQSPLHRDQTSSDTTLRHRIITQLQDLRGSLLVD